MTKREREAILDAAEKEVKAVHFFAVSDAAVRASVRRVVGAVGLEAALLQRLGMAKVEA
jgi:hypothetical protein